MAPRSKPTAHVNHRGKSINLQPHWEELLATMCGLTSDRQSARVTFIRIKVEGGSVWIPATFPESPCPPVMPVAKTVAATAVFLPCPARQHQHLRGKQHLPQPPTPQLLLQHHCYHHHRGGWCLCLCSASRVDGAAVKPAAEKTWNVISPSLRPL